MEKVYGVILKRSDIREVDRLLVLYTKERGRISVVAKGSRKIIAKLMPSLELFNYVEMELVRGKNLDTVVGVKVLNHFESVKNDLKKVLIAHYISEFVLRLLRDEEKDRNVFDLLVKVFEMIDKNDIASAELSLRVFELGILSSLGYCPELLRCVGCGKELLKEQNFFSSYEGGAMCSDCAKGRGFVLDPVVLKLLRIFLARDFDLVERLQVDKSYVLVSRRILEDYVRYVAEKNFKSYTILKKLCLEG